MNTRQSAGRFNLEHEPSLFLVSLVPLSYGHRKPSAQYLLQSSPQLKHYSPLASHSLPAPNLPASCPEGYRDNNTDLPCRVAVSITQIMYLKVSESFLVLSKWYHCYHSDYQSDILHQLMQTSVCLDKRSHHLLPPATICLGWLKPQIPILPGYIGIRLSLILLKGTGSSLTEANRRNYLWQAHENSQERNVCNSFWEHKD